MPITTAEELLRRSGELGRCELIRGELKMMMPPGGRHGLLAVRIVTALANHVEGRGVGEVLAETGFVLTRDPDTVRAPDISLVRGGREIDDRFIEGAPELAVEIVSPTDRPAAVSDKVAEWLEAGAEAVWVVRPRERTVTVHEGAGEPRVFGATDVLDGGSVLPGFSLELRALFG